jgi:hypothetical protein
VAPQSTTAFRTGRLGKTGFGSTPAQIAVEMHADKRIPIKIALLSAFSGPSMKPVQRLRVDGC